MRNSTAVAIDETPDPLDGAIAGLLRSNPRPFFVQVGGFDGVSFDPLRRHVAERKLAGLIAEPIPQYFEKLKALYADSPNVTAVNCAVAEADGERTIWQFNPVAVERGLLPPHFAGISSFLMEDLLKETGVLGRSSPNKQTTEILRKLLQPVTVQCRTMNSLLSEQGVDHVDILQIDTEGYDFIILKLFDFARYRPTIVHYEHQHLNPADREAAETLLRSHDYRIQRKPYDTLAVLDAQHKAGTSMALCDLALRLEAQGRRKDALLLLEHLAVAGPDNAAVLRPLVRLLSAEGRTLDAIRKLCALRDIAADTESLLGEIQRQTPPAIAIFNERLAAGDIAEAERYAAALAALLPVNKAFLTAAQSCNQALGRKNEADKYAMKLRLLDAPQKAATNPAPQPQAANAAHPLIRLRDLHEAASALLCEPLTRQSVAQVESLLAAARAITVDAPENSDLAGWMRHYRLMLDAVDLAAVQGPTPAAGREPEIKLAASTGTPVTWAELRASAARLGAKAVFFAAADRAYIDQYARWYIKSILKNCDVSCLIVVHAIGESGRLRDIAKTIGIRDRRLFFSGDHFDADAITTTCHDAPTKGKIVKPIAHLQSIRFLRLGHFLRKLERPIFVSDIDLLLQQGVADLLESAAGQDVQFNRNASSRHIGAHLTANLVLVNPTDNAARFLRFLRHYLERMLAKPAVTRWIDQAGLLMARHHLMQHGDTPRIGYFDTQRDINNVMYRTYQDNPFRFLSLYHGFDMKSLDALTDLAEAPKVARSTTRTRRQAGRHRSKTA